MSYLVLLFAGGASLLLGSGHMITFGLLFSKSHDLVKLGVDNMHDPLPCKVSQLNAPLCVDAVSYQLNSPACPCFTHFRLWFVIQPKEVLLNERTILPGDRRYDMNG